MSFSVDIDKIISRFAALSHETDHYALFFTVVIFLSCVYAVKFAFALLKGRRVAFSPTAILSFALSGIILSAFSFSEYYFYGEKFADLFGAIAYPTGAFCLITVLYAGFYSFARKDDGIDRGNMEAAPSTFPVRKKTVDKKVYAVITKRPDKVSDADVDFDGVYDFLNGLDVSDEKRSELKRRISFYDGTVTDEEGRRALNGLFYKAIRLSEK